MNPLVTLPDTHNPAYPPDYHGPHVPLRAAARPNSHTGTCHRCAQTRVIDPVHLVDADNTPLCTPCAKTTGGGLARGLQALNTLAFALRRPDIEPPNLELVRAWRAARTAAGPEALQLLDAAAQLLAALVGYTARPHLLGVNP